jgi:6-phosphogluconate dehydrogenase
MDLWFDLFIWFLKRFCKFSFKVCAFNRTVEKVDRFLENEAKGTNVVGAKTIQEFVNKLKKPRRAMIMIQAGKAVDDFIKQLVCIHKCINHSVFIFSFFKSWNSLNLVIL